MELRKLEPVIGGDPIRFVTPAFSWRLNGQIGLKANISPPFGVSSIQARKRDLPCRFRGPPKKPMGPFLGQRRQHRYTVILCSPTQGA